MKPTTHRPRNYIYTLAARLAGLDRVNLRAAAVKPSRNYPITCPVPEGTVAMLHECQPHAYGLTLAHLRKVGAPVTRDALSSRPRVVRTHQRQRRRHAPRLHQRLYIRAAQVHDAFGYLER
jgi:hypothetical protein